MPTTYPARLPAAKTIRRDDPSSTPVGRATRRPGRRYRAPGWGYSAGSDIVFIKHARFNGFRREARAGALDLWVVWGILPLDGTRTAGSLVSISRPSTASLPIETAGTGDRY